RLRPASRARRAVATHCSMGIERSARSPMPNRVAMKPVRPSVRRGKNRGSTAMQSTLATCELSSHHSRGGRATPEGRMIDAVPAVWTHESADAGFFGRRDALSVQVAGHAAGGDSGGEPGESGGDGAAVAGVGDQSYRDGPRLRHVGAAIGSDPAD